MNEELPRAVWELAADAIPAAIIAVHRRGTVEVANSAAYQLFGLSPADIGRPFQELEIGPGLTELCDAVEVVQKAGRPLVLTQIAVPAGPQRVDSLDIHLVPVQDGSGPLGVVITFINMSLARQLQGELEVSNRDLQTTHQELQAAIDELQATTRELHSTNEALEVMNAELQSINEELQTIKDELRSRTGELSEVNDFLDSILISQRGGFAILDRDLRISVWNDRSAELWGLPSDAAPGQHFLNLDIGLPVEDLREPIMAVLAGESEQETVDLGATNRRGREIRCRVSLTPLLGRDRQIRGVIVLVEEAMT